MIEHEIDMRMIHNYIQEEKFRYIVLMLQVNVTMCSHKLYGNVQSNHSSRAVFFKGRFCKNI